MATLKELEAALINADKAGDVEAAKILANEIVKLRAQPAPVSQPAPQPELTPAQKLTDIARGGARGAAKGLIGLAALPSMAQEGIASLMESMGARRPTYGLRTMPTYEQLTGLVEQIPGAEAVTQYQPQTVPGEYAETIGEFAAPGGVFARTAKAAGVGLGVGATGGAVQEAQEQAGASAVQALPLTIATSLAAGYALGPSRVQKYAKEIMKGVPDEQIALAKAVEAKAQDIGINLTAPELIENKILQGVGQIVYGSKEGGDIMYNYIKQRPQQINKVAEELLDEIIERPESVRQLYKNIGVTADKAIKTAEQTRRIKAENAGYIVSNVSKIDEAQVQNVLNQIDETIKTFPRNNPNIKKLEALKTRLTKDVDKNIPETNINKLSSAMREFRESIADSKMGVADDRRFINKEGRFVLFNDDGTGILNNLDNQLRTNIDYKNAQDTFARLSKELVEPVLDNVQALGKGVTPAKVKAFVFDDTKNNAADITKTYKLLNKEDKTAFPSIARAYVENAANKAFLPKEGGESLKSGFDLYKALAGSKAQQNNFNAVLKGVAEANNVNPNKLLLGFDRFNEVLKRTAKLANVNDPKIAPSTKNLPQTTAQIGSFMWRVKFASKYADYLGEKTMRDLAKIFTDEQSVKKLEQLATTDINSTLAVRRVVNIIAATSPLREDQPIEQPVPQ